MGRPDEVAIELGPPARSYNGAAGKGQGYGARRVPATLDPEARARLERQIAGVAAALATDAGMAALRTQVTADQEDPDWDAAPHRRPWGLWSHPGHPPFAGGALRGGPGTRSAARP